MILHNITSQVVPEVESEWMEWMQNTHIPNVLASGCFTQATLLKVHADTPDFKAYAVQYTAASKSDLERFLTSVAPELTQQIKAVFGENVLHFSTQLELISTHK